jgi:hypothetical protein
MLYLNVIALEEIVRLREMDRREYERQGRRTGFTANRRISTGSTMLSKLRFGRRGTQIASQSPLAAVERGYAGD